MLVQTAYGPVEGFLDTYPLQSRQNPDGQGSSRPISKWLGIRYAQAGRWERPRAPERWTDPVRAHEFGSAFPQPPSNTEKLLDNAKGYHARDWVKMSEDSHFVNVFGPANCNERRDKLPVLVFIYGGSLNNGSSERPLYDPTELVRASVDEGTEFLFVSFNYRTNVFGFFASPDLKALDEQGLCGNYGAYDCIAALEWVQSNIGAFGGDKDNVTVMGHSAGSFLVSQLLVSGKRLFKKACAHSGCVSTMGLKPIGQSYPAHSHITSFYGPGAATPSARVEGLRKVDWQDLLQGHNESYKIGGVGMTIEDAGIWTGPTIDRLERGEYDPWIESVILGTTEDEGSLFVLGLGLTSPDAARQWLAQYPAALQPAIERKYFADRSLTESTTTTNSTAPFVDSPLAKLFADQYFLNPAFEQAHALASAKHRETGSTMRVWKYRVRCEIDQLSRGKVHLGALHVVDIPLVCNVSSLWDADSHESGSARALRRRWLSYVTHGNPDQDWRAYDPARPSWLAIEKGGQAKNEDIKDLLDGMVDFSGRRARQNAVSAANE